MQTVGILLPELGEGCHAAGLGQAGDQLTAEEIASAPRSTTGTGKTLVQACRPSALTLVDGILAIDARLDAALCAAGGGTKSRVMLHTPACRRDPRSGDLAAKLALNRLQQPRSSKNLRSAFWWPFSSDSDTPLGFARTALASSVSKFMRS